MVGISLKAKYKKLLGDLLPIGRAWDNIKKHALLDAMAVEFTRVQGRADDILKEMYPGTADELLEDFEALLGLPDECTPENQSKAERRTQVLQKLATTGGISAEYYAYIARQLGFGVTIETVKPFRVGVNRVGDSLTNGWHYYYTVVIPATQVIRFRTGISQAGDPLVSYSNPLLECTLRKLKPAHAGISFRFETGV